MILSKIEHNFANEIFVPLASITSNYEFIKSKERKVVTKDDVLCNVVKAETFHILSPEAKELVGSIYNTGLLRFMLSWYTRFPNMDSMYFVYVKLERDDKT